MLYNVLPPTIFLLSLGGVIVVLSRVVVRIKKEEFASSVKSYTGSASSSQSVGGIGLGDMASVLKPNQKSVHAITSRLALVTSYFRKLPAGLADLANTAKQKASDVVRREKKEVAVKSETTSGAVLQPHPPVREKLAQIRSWAGSKVAGQANRVFSSTRQIASSLPGRRREKASDSRQDSGSAQEEAEKPLNRRRLKLNLPKVRRGASEAENAASGTIKRIHTKIVTDSQEQDTEEQTAPPIASSNPLSFMRREKEVVSSPLVTAKNAIEQKDYEKAEDILVSYILKHTKDTDAYMALGQIAVARGSWEEAMEIFDQVVSWNPNCPGAYAGLGTSSYRAGKYSRAILALQRAHEADPENTDVLNNLLSIAQKMDNRALQHSIQTKLSALGCESVQKAPQIRSEAERVR